MDSFVWVRWWRCAWPECTRPSKGSSRGVCLQTLEEAFQEGLGGFVGATNGAVVKVEGGEGGNIERGSP